MSIPTPLRGRLSRLVKTRAPIWLTFTANPMYRTLEEYHQLMMEAQLEFLAWESEKKHTRKVDKETARAFRLAKLDAKKLAKEIK